MKEKIVLLRITAERLKDDSKFWSSQLIGKYDRKKLNCSEQEFYKLCLCKIPESTEGLKKISEYCNVEIGILQKIYGAVNPC